MTRQYFIDEITELYELLEFCEEIGCDSCDEIVYDTDRDERIDQHVYDLVNDGICWEELQNYLNNILTGSEYYICDEDDEWMDAEDFFDDYKESVLSWCDENDVWDDSNADGRVLDLAEDEEDDFHFEEEPITVGELMNVCCGQLHTVEN